MFEFQQLLAAFHQNLLFPKKIPESEAEQHHYGIAHIAELSSLIGLDILETCNEWRDLQKKLTDHYKFCVLKKERTKDFWKYYLNEKDFEIGNNMKKIILAVMVTPVGSADAERGFSTLFHIRSKRRARLTREHLEMHLRIRLNSNKDITQFPAMFYAKKWKSANNGRNLRTDERSKVQDLEIQLDDHLFDEKDQETDAAHKSYLDGSNLF